MDITSIFAGLILIIFGVLSVFIIPVIKAHVSAADLKRILEYVNIAVGAAEQIAAASGYNGKWKKEYVQRYLWGKGFKVDDRTLDLMIEDAVIKLHNQLKE